MEKVGGRHPRREAGNNDAVVATGETFRQALEHLAAQERMDLLCEAPTVDDIEGQLQRVHSSSSLRLDGVGYDITRRSLPSFYWSCTQHSSTARGINKCLKAGSLA
ncbi:hypothetical protein P3T76_010675 [Phytophthora citrophthora]|uniref:Uncharacterized protein n=1 Tax=Phytophthora citrophthora TaxID=4793 RepID=A0AAD9LGC2_9STRA|nr:hypothetical protein P3T76_010675 [Phytophthora citrophthora]